MIQVGVAITAGTAAIFTAEFLRLRQRPLPLYGWLGLVALLVAEGLMFHGIEPVASYFTPIAWTAYIFLADAAVLALTGGSRFTRSPRELAGVAALSVPLWLLFEAYNLRLLNWTYIGLPQSWLARNLGYIWSFATITPGIFVTADLIEGFGWFRRTSKPVRFSLPVLHWMTVAGALLLTVPLVVPREPAAHLFAFVWVGFVFLLEPVNFRLRLPSLLGDLAEGRRSRLYALLLSGWVCGWLWEFWNYWAAAKWLYIFPMFQRWKILEMPAPGYFGFPPFALECFSMYVFARWLLGKLRPWAQLAASRTPEKA